MSPLQRMASITNSLVSQSPPISFSSGGGGAQRPLRNTLPPISQQQFDRYSHVNTDDTVRRIKEILSQYSISQRLFGEAVLGLSQVKQRLPASFQVLYCAVICFISFSGIFLFSHISLFWRLFLILAPFLCVFAQNLST